MKDENSSQAYVGESCLSFFDRHAGAHGKEFKNPSVQFSFRHHEKRNFAKPLNQSKAIRFPSIARPCPSTIPCVRSDAVDSCLIQVMTMLLQILIQHIEGNQTAAETIEAPLETNQQIQMMMEELQSQRTILESAMHNRKVSPRTSQNPKIATQQDSRARSSPKTRTNAGIDGTSSSHKPSSSVTNQPMVPRRVRSRCFGRGRRDRDPEPGHLPSASGQHCRPPSKNGEAIRSPDLDRSPGGRSAKARPSRKSFSKTWVLGVVPEKDVVIDSGN